MRSEGVAGLRGRLRATISWLSSWRRSPLVVAGLVALATALASCRSEEEPAAPEQPARRVVTIYSHARHGAERMAKVAGSDPVAQCAFCHASAGGKGERLANPAEATCYACHARADRAHPTQQACGLCHVKSPEPGWVAATELVAPAKQDARFSHAQHGSEACATCHEAVGATAGRENPGPTRPELCAQCHGQVKFSHEVHVVGQRLACDACHVLDKKGIAGTQPGVVRLDPTHKECYKCHPQATSVEPGKDCIYCHDSKTLDLAGPRAVRKLEKGDVIGFSHAQHEKSSCLQCHFDGATRKEGEHAQAPTMESCRACHAGAATFEGKPVATACAACHAVLRGPLAPTNHGDLVRPVDHTEGFLRHHAEPAREQGGKCMECHDLQMSCDACHQMEEPRTHTLRFKRTEHGESMTHDRESCVVCHQASFCSDCHSLQQPPSHRLVPNWVNGGHRLDARREAKRCYVCHQFAADCSKCHP